MNDEKNTKPEAKSYWRGISCLVGIASATLAGLAVLTHPESLVGEVSLELVKGAIGGALVGIVLITIRYFS